MEAEWEFACRAGNQAAWYGDPETIAWFYENSSDRPHPVAEKLPNDWGFHDMLGNVWELCEDVIHAGNQWREYRQHDEGDLNPGPGLDVQHLDAVT